jgi:hypothetical protein
VVPSSGWRVGADIGGTFTDVIALGPAGEVVPMKVLSTPPDYGTGVVTATTAVLDAAGAAPAGVAAMLHGTTVATNTILEMAGARTAVVTTQGFRDVLELGRLRRPVLYDLSWTKPVPLAPRRHRHELAQRITADGRLTPPADEADVRALAARLRADGIEAVAVCLLNSYVRPDEERRVAELLRAELPGVYVTASVDIPRSRRSSSARAPRPSTPTSVPSSTGTSPASKPGCATRGCTRRCSSCSRAAVCSTRIRWHGGRCRSSSPARPPGSPPSGSSPACWSCRPWSPSTWAAPPRRRR